MNDFLSLDVKKCRVYGSKFIHICIYIYVHICLYVYTGIYGVVWRCSSRGLSQLSGDFSQNVAG